MAQPDIKIIASPSSSHSSEQRHCSSLKLSHMWLLHQSQGALGSPMFPRKAWQQGKHSLPNTHALSQRQPAPHKLQQTLPFTRLVPGTQQQVLSDTMLKVWWGEVGNADSEKGRLRRNPEIKSYIRSLLSSAISAAVFLIFIKNKTCIYFVIFTFIYNWPGWFHTGQPW